MEIRVLRYFIEIAKEKNITKAAKNLHVTQPTISRQLKDLEEELQQKLFNRLNHSIQLTTEGEIFYKRALDIIDIVDKTTAEFHTMNKFNGGELHIGCAESYGITTIAKTIKSLNQKYPNIKFHLYSGNYQTVTEKLDKGILDFAITVQSVDTSNYKYKELPYKDIWGILMRKDSPIAKKEKITIPEIANLPLIISRQGFSDEMPNELKEMKDKINIVGTYDLLYNASLFVKENLGYALCFNKLVDVSQQSDLCFKEIEPRFSSPMKIIWSNKKLLSQSASLFLEELNKTI
ncbi:MULTISPECIES: LysR family transcriptional regulator [unclassified Gemella]|uniref:LysR family transcriptional regulator n=1 Tax=unclassified Gemella TaxID=2624949 RepID=UPI001C05C13A|nr:MULTISPECIES: LysR family transcriptional regulator [unclassified Gemella]MBU0278977.1 LysR family transcriptional regulator [Gemella sp. zg-1178]QWQ38759.1 LysR family transcriptional regulator [Gemella sp. zg-570]